MSDKETIGIEGGRLVLRERFPSTALSRFSENAPDLCEKLSDIFLQQGRLVDVDARIGEAETKEERDALLETARVELQQQTAFDTLRHGFSLAVETTVDELDALHDLCVALTADVEGYEWEDEEGRTVGWAHRTDGQRREFFDMHVSSTVKVTLFLKAFLKKTGIASKAGASDDGGDD